MNAVKYIIMNECRNNMLSCIIITKSNVVDNLNSV
jgi:hypothetical protein